MGSEAQQQIDQRLESSPARQAASYAIRHYSPCDALNAAICAGFAVWAEQASRRSHYFAGRFENIYIDTTRIPALAPLLARAQACAADITGIAAARLRLGFWFNAMRPGEVTLPHTHDDDDEVLSAVYYLCAPAGSGDLILHLDGGSTRLAPQPGMWVFFAPDCLHEVARNDSNELRLSLGINFGLLANPV